MAARLLKKVRGHKLQGFLYWRECPTNDIGEDPCHLPDIPYDAFVSPYDNLSMQHTDVELQVETTSQGK